MNLVCTDLLSLVEQNQTFVVSVKKSDVPMSDHPRDGHSDWVNDSVRKFTFAKRKMDIPL